METLSSIVNSKNIKLNNNSQLSIDNSKRVDLLIDDCKDLIDPNYRLWFIKRFYKITTEAVHRLAASVREQIALGKARNPMAIFTMLIKREAGF